jgi:small-conductance mechanosensitive channel
VSRFLHWCSFSAFGHVVLFEVAIAAPLMVLASIALQLAGLASAATLATTALVLAVGSAAIGLLTWLAITRPMLRKK